MLDGRTKREFAPCEWVVDWPSVAPAVVVDHAPTDSKPSTASLIGTVASISARMLGASPWVSEPASQPMLDAETTITPKIARPHLAKLVREAASGSTALAGFISRVQDMFASKF
jgi:hypothetical protein